MHALTAWAGHLPYIKTNKRNEKPHLAMTLFVVCQIVMRSVRDLFLFTKSGGGTS
jgi:hypothetical protein